jgi:PAS domain-containing protein
MIRGNSPSFEGLLDDLYASVSDPDRFSGFAANLRAAMNAHLVALQTDDVSHRHHVLQHFTDEPIEISPPDNTGDGSINLYFVRGAAQFFDKGVIDGSTLFAPGELERTEFYRQQLAPIDVHWSMGFCLSTAASGKLVALSVSRDKRRRGFEPEVMQLAHRLLPHLRNVYDMQQRLQTLGGLTSGLDCLACAVWLIDREGLILYANAEAQRQSIDERAGLGRHRRQLRPCWQPDRPALQHALASAISPIAGQRAEMLLHDASGQAWAACSVHPLHQGTFGDWALTRQAVAVVFVHSLVHARPSTAVLRHIFALTPAEAELACALLQHGSLAGCVGTQGKRRETLRTQLKALFAKTETRGQADLIRRLEAALN